MKSVLVRLLAGGARVAALVMGIAAVVPPVTEARPPCLCPDIVAPVICDNGQTYINSCVATCNHARNCVRTGD